MRQFFRLLLIPILLVTFDANALLITDTRIFNQQLFDNQSAGHVFDLTEAGYSPTTDSITNIKLIYDFTEINADVDTGEDETREFVIFSSWIFGWRDVHPDIDSGLTLFETSWQKSNMCQIYFPDGDDSESCAYNLDVDGRMNAFVTAYTDNLWLNSISVTIDVDRQVNVPAPSSASLFILGLVIFSVLHKARRDINPALAC